MIEVSVLVGDKPFGEGVAFELVSESGTVLATAATDAAGVASFDVDSAGLGAVSIRCAPESDGTESNGKNGQKAI
jgi:hypothetical protein